MNDFENFRISPKFRVSEWIMERDALNWTGMVAIFQDRLDGRFLKAIELIRADTSDVGNYSGFSIISLDCLIIETLKQFHDGLKETANGHELQFKNFFKSSQTLTDFGTDEMARVFYYHFRCGLLHQAQTKKKSKIKRGLETLYIQEKNITDGITIDRDIFHDCLLHEIEYYKGQLLIDANRTFRDNFIRKMNFICNLNN